MECEELVEFALSQPRTFPNRIEIRLPAMKHLDLIHRIRADTKFTLSEFFGQKLYHDLTMFSVNFRGDFHSLHADNVKEVDGKWVPNHTWQRCISSGIYLNSCRIAYDGGEFEFAGQEKMPMREGQLLAFPSNEQFLHQVLPIINGERVSLMQWFTQDETRDEWSAYEKIN